MVLLTTNVTLSVVKPAFSKEPVSQVLAKGHLYHHQAQSANESRPQINENQEKTHPPISQKHAGNSISAETVR